MSLLARVKHPPNITDYTEVNVHPAEQYLSVDDHGFLQTSPETSGTGVVNVITCGVGIHNLLLIP